MTFDKKPSMYPDYGSVGSAEELDAYGIWVKSEPQDISSGFADAVGLGSQPMPFDSDFEAAFNAGFDDIGVSGLADFGDDPSGIDIDIEGFRVSSFDDDISETIDQPEITNHGMQDEKSTQLLMRIADELTTIRSELTTLKNEFIDIREDGGFEPGENLGFDGISAADSHAGGFFEEEDDEKIALTGDEMESFLTSTDFSTDENDVFAEDGTLGGALGGALDDPLGDALGGALGDALGGPLDNLSNVLDDDFFSESDFDARREEDAAALRKLSDENEASMAAGFDMEPPPALDEDEEIVEIDLDFENLGITIDEEPQSAEALDAMGDITEDITESITEDMLPVPSLDDLGEINELLLDGADHLEPTPDNTSYLEDDPFAIADAGFDDMSLTENALDINIDDAAFDLSLDDLTIEESPVDLQDELQNDMDFASLDLSDAVIDEPDEPALGAIDDLSLGLDDFETSITFDAEEDSIAEVIPEGFELRAEEESIPFDDDLDAFAEEELSASGEVDISSLPEISPADIEKLAADESMSPQMRKELKEILTYMDNLLESLPEDKIKEFAQSEHFDTYRKLFKELGLV